MFPISAAGSDGRCNTLHCIDSTKRSSANDLFGRVQSKPSQDSVPIDLTGPRVFSFCFQCRIGLYLVLHRPIETTQGIGKVGTKTYLSGGTALIGTCRHLTHVPERRF